MRPLPAADLDERVRLAPDRGAALLAEPEREVAQTILDLPDDLALAYARPRDASWMCFGARICGCRGG